jgi:signal transduction histidine kinase
MEVVKKCDRLLRRANGTSPRWLKSIFSGFYRGHASRDGELGNSGLGLGLSIVHDCIGALKGDVHVESERGKGATFFIELPLTPPL